MENITFYNFLKNPPLQKSLPPNWLKIPQSVINPPFWPHWKASKETSQPARTDNKRVRARKFLARILN